MGFQKDNIPCKFARYSLQDKHLSLNGISKEKNELEGNLPVIMEKHVNLNLYIAFW